ncbi:hypothetical protein BC828DRAFT_421948 [Blastocladiella britannica]|nr:hypothetical protein BC828DRAFT_421948 [Blastocladiella britannica]
MTTPTPSRISRLILVLALIAVVLVNAASTSYYDLLGVARDADKRTISRAYRKLALKYHPDKNPDDNKAKDTFVKLANAYEVLNDEEKRRIYDQYGEDGLKQGGGNGGGGGGQGFGGFHDPFDIFNQYVAFGGGFQFNFGGAGSGAKRGPDTLVPLHLTLAELYAGLDTDVDIARQVVCPSCRGSGAKSERDVHTCNACGGRGVKLVRQMLAPGMFTTMQQVCDECAGKGKKIAHVCPACQGAKVARGRATVTVSLDPGTRAGTRVVVEGAADAGPDIVPGNVVFEVREVPHPIFQRDGDDLRCKVQIGLSEALLGFQRELVHLDGRSVALIRNKKVTPPGFIQALDNEGMPILGAAGAKGRLYVEYQVIFPADFADTQREGTDPFFFLLLVR